MKLVAQKASNTCAKYKKKQTDPQMVGVSAVIELRD